MKKHNKKFIVFVVFIAAMCYLVIYKFRESPFLSGFTFLKENGASNEQVLVPIQRVPRMAEAFDPAASNAWAARQYSQTWLQDPLAKAAAEGALKDPSWNWKRPIDFYGVVFDENGLGVPDARVSFQWTNISAEDAINIDGFTDNSGSIELRDKQGYVLSVTVFKDGYYTPTGGSLSFNYAEPWDLRFHRPDAQRPIILKLRKKGQPEPLVHRWNLEYNTANDQGSILVDLLGQRQVNSGHDLQFTMSHGPEVILKGQRRFDWKVEVAAADGGLVVYDEEFPFLAPEEGYEPILRGSMKADDPDWTSGFERKCFFRSRGGQHYGRIIFRVSPFPKDSPPGVTLNEYYLNPAGSRNLEFNANLEVGEKFYVPR